MRLGIDLGTTRTIVAAADRGNYPIVAFENLEGDMVEHIPTVSAEANGELIHGFEAAALATRGLPHLRSWKRLLADHGPGHRVSIGGLRPTLLEIASGFAGYVKRHLLEASNLQSRDIGEVVVSVPANAHSSQRFTTLEAFGAAGFEVAAMLNEPSAAGIEYAHRHRGTLNRKREHVAIYDLGGGTFDAALVMVADDHHDVVDTGGIHHLGGDDFDLALLIMALDELGIDPADVVETLPSLLLVCRDAKEQIGPNTKNVVLELEGLGAPLEPLVLSVADYYERLRPLVDQSIAVLSRIMDLGGDTAPEVDVLKARAADAGVAGVYIVGGGSALPLVPRMLRKQLSRRVHRSPHPAGAIAMGLAIAADETAAPTLTERFTRHLGVFREAEKGGQIVFDPIFARGTMMPARNETLVETRAYRAAHDIGHFRFVECGALCNGEPDGDISPHADIVFPFAASARNGTPLRENPVQRLRSLGPLIEERYEVDAAGVVSVTIRDVQGGYSERFVL
jgi:molecular chaperone DnaK (HSP70)